jgi:hypothetical protein
MPLSRVEFDLNDVTYTSEAVMENGYSKHAWVELHGSLGVTLDKSEWDRFTEAFNEFRKTRGDVIHE